MKIEIVLHGRLKNKIIEKDIPESQLVHQITFINLNGFFDADAWYPPSRIKEIRYEYPVASKMNRVFMENNNDES